MKTVRKTLILAACAILLVCATVVGTLAYLTSTAAVENTFTVGNVGIKLSETKVNPDGTPVEGTGAGTTEEGNNYHLLPGHSYTKNPKITVSSGSEDCYLFVKVENGIKDIEDPSASIATQMEEKGWTAVDDVENVYVYTKEGNPAVVKASDEVSVFDSFKIKGDVKSENLNGYSGKKVTVTAYAVQKDGFDNKTAKEIWDTAFGTSEA